MKMTWDGNWTMPDGTKIQLNSPEMLRYFFYYCANHPEDSKSQELLSYLRNNSSQVNGFYQTWLTEQQAYDNANKQGDMNSYFAEMGAAGITPNESTSKAADNDVSRENVESAQDYNTQQRDTSLLSAASQLSQLGLSTSNVINTGGVQGPGVVSAASNMQKVGTLAQQRAMNKYNQQMGMAKSILSMVGQMASSGIYGTAIGAAKHSASVLAGATAHSAQKALMATNWDGKGNGSLLSGKLGEEWSKLPGAY